LWFQPVTSDSICDREDARYADSATGNAGPRRTLWFIV
jgi:hypothetical protein